MIDQHQIMQMATHVFRHANGRKSKRLLHPKREWIFGLSIVITILIIGGSYASATYLYYQNVDASHGHTDSNIPRYNRTLVDQTVTLYRDRASAYEKLSQSGRIALPTSPAVQLATSSVPSTATGTPASATSTVVQ